MHWIGLRRSSSSDVWNWTDNSQLEFLNWSSGQPNGGGEECVYVSINKFDFVKSFNNSLQLLYSADTI